ncbi:MAG TPA: methyltransferase domain-containing protein, partial [Leptospiraceae bacterium]|nr:methyltransferase domain-containing protein [Leptospiraceae bacterium]
MAAKEHYDKHLGSFYSWMVGDFESKQNEFSEFLNEMKILPRSSKNVIDLGAGHGIQTISLAKLGFHVTAIDFNEQLLQELKKNSEGFDIKIVND